jgi:hypothetical protein
MNHENYVNRDYLIQLQNQQKTQNEKEKSFYEGKKDYTETLRKSLERQKHLLEMSQQVTTLSKAEK